MGLNFGLRTASNPVLCVCARGPCFLVWWAALMRSIVLVLNGLFVVLIVPYRIQRCRKFASLPVIVTIPQDFPLSLHLAEVFFTHVSRCISPFLKCFTSLIKVFPDHSCMFS